MPLRVTCGAMLALKPPLLRPAPLACRLAGARPCARRPRSQCLAGRAALMALTVKELKGRCKERKLKVSGKKEDLVRRLLQVNS